jgi:PiT family inorganic phosphate transporter
MVFALLISAIVWNLGTWYLGLPASSSHTLIGAILGVGLANSVMRGHPFGSGVNWDKAGEVGLSLLISPIIGFLLAGLLLVLLRAVVKDERLFQEPPKGEAPPGPVRGLLVLTCTLVSFFHGSNDGQKGMGLMTLILVGILPTMYALKPNDTPEQLHALAAQAHQAQIIFSAKGDKPPMDETAAATEVEQFTKSDGVLSERTYTAMSALSAVLESKLLPVHALSDIPDTERASLRKEIYLLSSGASKLIKSKRIADAKELADITTLNKSLESETKYIPPWVKFAIAFALGCGTTVGWKRIVVTVGEKIGKSHLTYGQGASAELVAALTIAMADWMGLPVSTTHVLSSGVAGTMAFSGSGLQAATLRNILLAWVLTLPVCMFLGSMLFAFGNFLVFHVLGVH